MTRNDAILCLKGMKNYGKDIFTSKSQGDWQESLDMAIKALEQEPKIGHWITTRTIMHDGEYYCDQCKCDSPGNEKWNYCPNCGAKMVEPQENEE